MRRLLPRGSALTAALYLLGVGPSSADDPGLLLARARLAEAGQQSGNLIEDFNGQSVKLVRLPISFKLLDPEDRPWKLRLRIPVSLGFYDLRATIEGQLPLETSISTITVQPGVQLVYSVNQDWELKPYLELGGAFDVSGSGGGAFLFSGGITSLTHFPWRNYVWSVGAQVEYDNGWFEGAELDIAGFTTADVGVDFLFPVAEWGAGRRFEMSAYLMHRRFFPPAQFDRVNDEILDIDYQHEVGLTFGLEPATRLFGLKMPRLGVAHRWGDGFRSWRLNFGFPF